jgi:signal transduction histidine kinase
MHSPVSGHPDTPAGGLARIPAEIAARVRRELQYHARSLRGRLLGTLIALMLALVPLSIWIHLIHLRKAESLLLHEQRRGAAAAAAHFRGSLDILYRAQDQIALAVLTGRMYPGLASSYLQEVRDRYPGLLSLRVVDAYGRTQYQSPERLGPPESGGIPALARLSPAAPRYLSTAYRDSPGGLEKVRVASLTTDGSGRVLGATVMEFSLPGLRKLIPTATEEGQVLLLDGSDHTVLGAASPDASRPAGLESAAHEARSSHGTVSLDGSLGAAAPVPGTDWIVLHLSTRSPAEADIMADANASILFVGLLAVLLGVAVILVVRISLRPVVTLSAGARLLGAGELSLRLPRPEVLEFETVVEAFNNMASQLEQARNQLLEANRDLEERVQERARALEEKHQELLRAERLSSVGLLSSAIAHDLRNPLNTINLAVEWLRLRLANEPDEKVRARLGSIQRELQRAREIIQTLLDFARTGEPKRAPCSLNALVEQVIQVVQPPARVVVDLQLESGLAPFRLDQAQFSRVLENLMRNAIQAMPGDGVLRVATRVVDQRCLLSVSDTGAGIPPDLLDSVFDPLVTSKPTGTGLGLALCKRIVEAHGGRIWVESAPGEGAAFCIDLPIA